MNPMSSVSRAQREQCQQPRPSWVPEHAGDEFATWVVEGAVPSSISRAHRVVRPRRLLTVGDYLEGIRRRQNGVLAQAITLIESNAPAHQELAEKLLTRILPQTGGAMRIGITGIPGVGKSTFIETLGTELCERGRRVAVLAVDPSSTITGGSILADKIRMAKLGRQPGAFIRPSPSGGTLGGVARKTREALLLCEAAGYDVIIVETVGVGQNEVAVRSLVDCFVVLTLGGTGDEMQGMKKGVLELADLIVINKAEDENRAPAMLAQAEMKRVLGFLRPATEGWQTPALLASAKTGLGVLDVWSQITEFFKTVRLGGMLSQRRRSQAVAWMKSQVEETLLQEFYRDGSVKHLLPDLEKSVAEGKLSATSAARQLLRTRDRAWDAEGSRFIIEH